MTHDLAFFQLGQIHCVLSACKWLGLLCRAPTLNTLSPTRQVGVVVVCLRDMLKVSVELAALADEFLIFKQVGLKLQLGKTLLNGELHDIGAKLFDCIQQFLT